MNRNDLYKSFNEIDDDMLLRTEVRQVPKRSRPRIRFIAASAALFLCIFGISFLLSPDYSNDNASSWFVVTAYAADGDYTELGLNDGCFNSGGTDQNAFGVDVPLFSFAVEPSNLEGNQEAYSNFVITVSYNGKIVDSPTDHVMIFNLIPLPGSDASYGYDIMGWFEEPTDIIITISDRETGTLIEEQTVNVCFDHDSQAYQLTVTNIRTKEAQ